MSDEHLHDWLDNRPGPDRPSLAEAQADEHAGHWRCGDCRCLNRGDEAFCFRCGAGQGEG